MEKIPPHLKPGQIWQDNDYRSRGRRLHILALIQKGAPPVWYAEVENVRTGQSGTIRADRFRKCSTGYTLVSEAPGSC